MTRPHIERAYGFTTSSSKKGIEKNKERYLELMADRSFHYEVCTSMMPVIIMEFRPLMYLINRTLLPSQDLPEIRSS
jgi:hypothetical protein